MSSTEGEKKYYPKGSKRPKQGFINIRNQVPWTEKQKDLFSLLQDRHTVMCFVEGPAGTAKSYTSIYSALHLLNDAKISKIFYVRCAVESASKSLGALPGFAEDKMAPYMRPLHDKLEELLCEGDVKKVLPYIEACPINYMRGASLNDCVVIFDEVQNAEYAEILTQTTRMGSHSRIWLLGDPQQSDLKGNRSGFTDFADRFDDEESEEMGIFNFEFGVEDIVRSELCKFIVERTSSI